MTDLARFSAECDRIAAAPRNLHVEAVQRLIEAGFSSVVLNSPVRNGYYRAGHTIGLGTDQPTRFLFEHPERVGESGPYPERASPIGPPDSGAAAAAVREIPFGAPMVVWNGVRHAGLVEFGTAYMPARLVYQRALDLVSARMADEELRMSAEFRKITGE